MYVYIFVVLFFKTKIWKVLCISKILFQIAWYKFSESTSLKKSYCSIRKEFARYDAEKGCFFKRSDFFFNFAIFKARKCVPYDQSKLFAHNAFKIIIQLNIPCMYFHLLWLWSAALFKSYLLYSKVGKLLRYSIGLVR